MKYKKLKIDNWEEMIQEIKELEYKDSEFGGLSYGHNMALVKVLKIINKYKGNIWNSKNLQLII